VPLIHHPATQSIAVAPASPVTRLMLYADHAATTPCRPEVAELMRRVLVEDFGNPSNINYPLGRAARAHLDTARERVAAAIAAQPAQITFTSGSTESCNLVIQGVMQRLIGERPRLVAAATEHPCVLEPMQVIGAAGGDFHACPVQPSGALGLHALRELVDERTALVGVMLVNNETGVVNPVAEAAEICHRYGALLLCDATQAIGRLTVDVDALGCDFLCYTAHKIYGPKGSGCLWRRRGLALTPLLYGGGQERGLRPGTENVAGAAGFGLAAELATHDVPGNRSHLQHLSDHLESRLGAAVPGLVVHGSETERAPGTSFVSSPAVPRSWLAQLARISCSGGSACHTGKLEGSAVLHAMGVPEAQCANAVRLSFGRSTSEADVDAVATAMIEGAERLIADATARPG